MISVREAILRAADSIEQNPHLFDFGSLGLPDHDCGTPGCALGWIAYHSGIEFDSNVRVDHATDNPGYGGVYWGLTNEIYDFLGIARDNTFHRLDEFGGGKEWTRSPYKCAQALRACADKFHPAENKHTGLPASVTEIFEQVAA